MSKQFILGLIGLSSVTACLTWWFCGAISGFHLFEKLPEKIKKAWRVYAALTLLTGGGVVGVAGMRGCGGFATASAQPAPVSTPARRQVIKLTSPLEVLGGLRLQRTKEEREEKQKAEAERRKVEAEARKQLREEKRRLREEAQLQFMMSRWSSNAAQTTSISGAPITIGREITPVGSRKGPFCRVTCAFHHSSSADVEVDGSYCNAKVIPPDAESVPGWARTADGQGEFQNDWPGPANSQRGLDSYKLYWTSKPGK